VGYKKPLRTKSHPLFGEIPLYPTKVKTISGREEEVWKYDLTYKPRMPAGAVASDPTRQLFCPMCHVPKFFYVDEEKICVSCGERFVFGAGEQKYWYEDLQFNFHSKAIRCVECRRRIREVNSLRRQLSAAARLSREKPNDPMALLALVEATLEQFEAWRKGDLDRALAAARRAAKLSPDCLEAIYWEARCQESAGRKARAATRYDDFIERARTQVRYTKLYRDARNRLRRITSEGPGSV
jgi:tetratricopeptide (TPR) repeat protein